MPLKEAVVTARRTVAGLVVIGVVIAWGVSRVDKPKPHYERLVRTQEYLPGAAADVFLPATTRDQAPVVILVPGGSWRSADRAGLAPLAETLAERGMTVVNATYRAADSGARFPEPVADIVCAVDFGAEQARLQHVVPGPVVVVGHSSGAQLASLAALEPTRFRANCPYPQVDPDGFVGLSGPYDITAWQAEAAPMFARSPAQDPQQWREANPFTWAASRTGTDPLSVLLAHGVDDYEVSLVNSSHFATALKEAGHPVQLSIVPGATHGSIYQPGVIADTLATWASSLVHPATTSQVTS
jgi:acetyl esterase/lipase